MKDVSRVVFFMLLSAGVTSAVQSTPNIIFILADDLGWNDVSWHNSSVVTPHLQELVDTGVLLEQNYVQPICTPTRSALLTGYYPYHLGRQRNVLVNKQPTGLTLSKRLLPERLSQLGYTTHAIGKWHLGFCDWAYVPTYRGFDTFYGFYVGGEKYFTHDSIGGYDFRDGERVAWEANGTHSTDLFADRAVEVIEEQQGKEAPFYLYLAFQNVHTPLEVPDEYLEFYPDEPDSDRQKLLGLVTAMDDAVGRVVKALHTTGLYDNTLIIFSSDNGGSLRGKGSSYPLRGNKGTLWEGGTRVPALVHGPLLENTPRVHRGLLHVTDWYSTLMAVAGAQELPDTDGFNQWEVLRTGNIPSPRHSFIYNLDESEENGIVGAIRMGRYKFLMGKEPHTEEHGPWLFDLDDDPNETTNLVETQPTLAAELELLLLAQLESLVAPDVPADDPAGDAENWGGAWSPGWCTAH
ncbi:arylsulfatase B-like [Panulirus ornatus]|uniref:arylsulfatase B-like n=1 Tax=Panulirus ornatus TaxID=150431 RepID=UPI003A873055